LTVEHNAGTNQAEVERVTKAGAFVLMGKVAGVLSVTRFVDIFLYVFVFFLFCLHVCFVLMGKWLVSRYFYFSSTLQSFVFVFIL
jgi:hypothetical protein